jgi:hypothetical protein
LKLTNIIENFKNYKKGYKQRAFILKLWRRADDGALNILVLLPLVLTLFLVFPALFAFIIPASFFFKALTFMIFVVIAIFNAPDVLNILSKLTVGKIKNIHPALSFIWSDRIVLSKYNREKINQIVTKKFKKEDYNHFLSTTSVIKEIQEEKIEHYLEENGYFPSKKLAINNARMTIEANKITLLDIIHFYLNKSTIEELENLDKNKLKEALKDFSIEEQINVTDIITAKLEEKNAKQNKLNSNLEKINNLSKTSEVKSFVVKNT